MIKDVFELLLTITKYKKRSRFGSVNIYVEKDVHYSSDLLFSFLPSSLVSFLAGFSPSSDLGGKTFEEERLSVE